MVMSSEICSGNLIKQGPDLMEAGIQGSDAHHLFDGLPVHGIHPSTASNRVLKVTFTQVFCPITEMVLHQVFDPYGVVQGIELIWEAVNMVALVEYGSYWEAAQAIGALHGRCIYDGCCELNIEYTQTPGLPMEGAYNPFSEMPSNQKVAAGGVLCISISHVYYPVTEELLHQVYDIYGAQNVMVFTGTDYVKATVWFCTSRDAEQARNATHGRCIYDGCCVLDVQLVTETTSGNVTATSMQAKPAPSHNMGTLKTVTTMDATTITTSTTSAMENTSVVIGAQCAEHSELAAKAMLDKPKETLNRMIEDSCDVNSSIISMVVESTDNILALPLPEKPMVGKSSDVETISIPTPKLDGPAIALSVLQQSTKGQSGITILSGSTPLVANNLELGHGNITVDTFKHELFREGSLRADTSNYSLHGRGDEFACVSVLTVANDYKVFNELSDKSLVVLWQPMFKFEDRSPWLPDHQVKSSNCKTEPWPQPSQADDMIDLGTMGFLYGHEVILPKPPWLSFGPNPWSMFEQGVTCNKKITYLPPAEIFKLEGVVCLSLPNALELWKQRLTLLSSSSTMEFQWQPWWWFRNSQGVCHAEDYTWIAMSKLFAYSDCQGIEGFIHQEYVNGISRYFSGVGSSPSEVVDSTILQNIMRTIQELLFHSEQGIYRPQPPWPSKDHKSYLVIDIDHNANLNELIQLFQQRPSWQLLECLVSSREVMLGQLLTVPCIRASLVQEREEKWKLIPIRLLPLLRDSDDMVTTPILSQQHMIELEISEQVDNKESEVDIANLLQAPWDPGGFEISGLRASRISSGGECHVLGLIAVGPRDGWAMGSMWVHTMGLLLQRGEGIGNRGHR